MKCKIDIVYDDEMKELLDSENILQSTVRRVIGRFIIDKLEFEKTEKSNFNIPFVNTDGKRFSLYGAMEFNSLTNSYIFEIELLGVTIKTVKFKDPAD